MRSREAGALGLTMEQAFAGTTTNGTYVRTSIRADERFWRVVGLYIAEDHCSADGRRRAASVVISSSDEMDLVEEVLVFWRLQGADDRRGFRETSTTVTVPVEDRRRLVARSSRPGRELL